MASSEPLQSGMPIRRGNHEQHAWPKQRIPQLPCVTGDRGMMCQPLLPEPFSGLLLPCLDAFDKLLGPRSLSVTERIIGVTAEVLVR